MSEIKTWQARLREAGLNDWPDTKPYMLDEITELRAAKAADDKRLEWLRINIDSAITRENIDQAMQGANKTRQPSK